MKRLCKDIDITDVDFIKDAVKDCLDHKPQKAGRRADVQRVINLFGNIDRVAIELSQQIQDKDLYLPEIRWKTIEEWGGTEMKVRLIAIEDIWIQFFDYICVHALEPLTKRIGFYQCGCIKGKNGRKGKGQIWGIHQIYSFINKRHDRHCIKSDVKQCYPSISQKILMVFLQRHVKNNMLLWLVQQVLSLADKGGLLIGSRLSILLCQLYMSIVYHKMEFMAYKTVTRNGVRRRVQLYDRMIVFMDDIYLFGKNARDLHDAFNILQGICMSLHMTLKDSWITIDTEHATVDGMGFRVGKGYIKMRRNNYLNVKKAIKAYKRKPNVKTAKTLVSYQSDVKWSDSYRFRRKYHWKSLYRDARRRISDESKIRNSGACGNSVPGRWQQCLYPDCA